MFIQHILVIFIMIGVPLLNVYGLRRLKRQASTTSKILTYLQTIAVLWVMTGLIWYASPTNDLIKFEQQTTLGWVAIGAFTVCSLYLVIVTFVPFILLRQPSHRQQMEESFQQRAYIMPLTSNEQAWFSLVAISVGICEEIIFRSFLTQYFMQHPFKLTIALSIAAAVFIFAYGHFHQGFNGMLNAGVFAYVMSMLFIMTGSLWMPILIHIAYDLRILVLARGIDMKLEKG